MSNVKGAPQAAAGEPGKANGTAMVTVGCKLPNGLICELGRIGDDDHTVVRLNGANSARVIGGYGLTQVSSDFWNAWVAKHRSLTFVKNGLVFAHNDEASASDHAKDVASTRTGFEAIDPTKKIVGADGKPLLETDMDHFHTARSAAVQFGGARR